MHSLNGTVITSVCQSYNTGICILFQLSTENAYWTITIHSPDFFASSQNVTLQFDNNYTMNFYATSTTQYTLKLSTNGIEVITMSVPVTDASFPIGDFRGWVGIVYVFSYFFHKFYILCNLFLVCWAELGKHSTIKYK